MSLSALDHEDKQCKIAALDSSLEEMMQEVLMKLNAIDETSKLQILVIEKNQKILEDHIGFINVVYERLRMPLTLLEFIANKFMYILSPGETKALPPSSSNDSRSLVYDEDTGMAVEAMI